MSKTTNESTTTTTISKADLMGKTTPDLLALAGTSTPDVVALILAVVAERAQAPVVGALTITMLPGGYVEIRDKAGFRGDVARLTVDRAMALSAPGVAERLRKAAEATAKAWPADRCTRYWNAYKAAAADPAIKALLDSSDKAKAAEGRKLRDAAALAGADVVATPETPTTTASTLSTF